MKKFIKLLLITLIAVVLLLAAAGVYIRTSLPDIALIDLKVELTPQRIERGRYLAEHVAVCLDCHSTRDWNRFSGPMVSGSEGQGGEKFTPEMGLPGTFIAPNITPASLNSWSDAEIYRAVTSGVAKDGRALFPLMPWPAYSKMDREDIFSLIAFVRSLEPKSAVHPVSVPAFPLSLIMRTFPKVPTHQPIPPASAPSAEQGKYLVNASGCIDCHSPVNKGQIIEGKEFSGGREFLMPGGTVRSANITPDISGLEQWTKEIFISRFKAYRNASNAAAAGTSGFNSPMPWTMYAGMTDEDLGKMFEYLKTVKPIANTVQKFTPR